MFSETLKAIDWDKVDQDTQEVVLYELVNCGFLPEGTCSQYSSRAAERLILPLINERFTPEQLSKLRTAFRSFESDFVDEIMGMLTVPDDEVMDAITLNLAFSCYSGRVIEAAYEALKGDIK